MNISMKRIQAIFLKDYKEFSRNYAISVMLFFPIIFAILYRSDSPSTMFMYAFVLNFSLSMMTSFIQAALIAEEKEKNTLRSLMMTPASILDVLFGKSLFVITMSAVIFAVTIYILGYLPDSISFTWFVISLLLSIILYTSLGTICGLYSKTVMEATLAVFPVLIIFTMGQFGVLLEERFAAASVLQYLPSAQLSNLMEASISSYTTGDLLKPTLIIAVWTVVITIISIVLYKKRLMDE